MNPPFGPKFVGIPSLEKASLMPPSMALLMTVPDVVATDFVMVFCSVWAFWLLVGVPVVAAVQLPTVVDVPGIGALIVNVMVVSLSIPLTV